VATVLVRGVGDATATAAHGKGVRAGSRITGRSHTDAELFANRRPQLAAWLRPPCNNEESCRGASRQRYRSTVSAAHSAQN
jgi:hypothetical protein